MQGKSKRRYWLGRLNSTRQQVTGPQSQHEGAKRLPSSFRERSLRNPITEIRRAKFEHVTIANIAHKRLGSSAGVLTNHIRTGLNECVFEFQPGERPKNFIDIALLY